MDKQEYKIRSQEIKTLIAEKKFNQAMAVADTIDWSRVKSIPMLCMISDLYKLNRKYEISRDVLLEAYNRSPENRKIVYSLCELFIKLGQIVEAIEFYKSYMYLAPTDSSKYILQFKLYAAQEVSLEEQISVLEEFKRRDYREKWAYELAFLYHRLGLQTRCIEACDELIVWFGDGKYVQKAMELKMLHAPLTKGQQILYDRNNHNVRQDEKIVPEGRKQQVQISREIKDNLVTESADKVSLAYLEEVVSKNVAQFYTEAELNQTQQENNVVIVEKPIFEDVKKPEILEIEEPMAQVQKIEDSSVEEKQDEQALEVPEIGILEDLTSQQTKIFGTSLAEDTMMKTIEIPEVIIEDLGIEEENLSENMDTENQEEVAKPILNIDLPTELQSVLAKGYNGPIHLVVPSGQADSSQIVGKIILEDTLTGQEAQLQGENIVEFVAPEKDEAKKVEIPLVAEHLKEVENLLKADAVKEVENTSEFGVQEDEEEGADGFNQIIFEDEEDEFEEEFLDEEDFLVKDRMEQGNLEELDEETVKEDSMEQDDLEELDEEIVEDDSKIIELSDREKTLFAPFIHTRKELENLTYALNHINFKANQGNVIIIGANDYGTKDLAKCIVKEMQMTKKDFVGKMAKIAGSALNGRNVEGILQKLQKGSLIIENAGEMNSDTVDNLLDALKKVEVMVILECTKKYADKLYRNYPTFKKIFDACIEIEELDDNTLVIAGKKYAQKLEYSIDELGLLALHTRIADMQTIDHKVTIEDVRQIVDEAIIHANRKNIGHFMELITGSRYDKEDMIVLREKDFII